MIAVLKNKRLWGSIVAVFFLWLSFRGVRLADFASIGSRLQLSYVFPALALGFLMVAMRAVRWQGLIAPTRRIPTSRVIPLYALGLTLNIAMPALTGHVGRLLLFARRESIRKTVIFSTFLMETLFDALTFVAFMAITSALFVFPAEYRSASWIVGGVCLAVIGLLTLYLTNMERLGAFGRRYVRVRWRGVYITLKKFSRSFTKGMAGLRTSSNVASSLGLSVGTWLAHAAMVYLLFRAFGFHTNLPLVAAFVILIVNTLALLVPLTPGNAGTFEFAVITTLRWFGLEKTDALLFAVTLHILDILPIFLLGALPYKAPAPRGKESVNIPVSAGVGGG